MNKEKFIKIYTSLGLVYSKEFNIEQLEMFYSLLNDLNIKSFKQACREISKKNKYMPSIAEIREEVKKIEEEQKQYIFNATIEKMKQDGYFANPTEYEKIMNWYSNGIIPSWFKEDMKKYEPKLLDYTIARMIGD